MQTHDGSGQGPGEPSAAANPDARDWYERETSIRQIMRDELTRLKRRTKSHPIRVFLLAALMTSAVVWKYAQRTPLHRARVMLRVTEGELTQDANPLPAQTYTDHIYHAVLTRDRLLAMMKRLDLYRSDREKFGDDYAVTQLRDALSINVFRNFFFFYRNYESVPRSLRLVVSFQDPDPEFAYKMAHELAVMVMGVETERRRQISRYAAANAREYMDKLRQEVAFTEGQLNNVVVLLTQVEELGDDDAIAELTTRQGTLNALLDSQHSTLEALLLKQDQIEIESELDKANLGLQFEIAGEDIPRATPPPGPVLLAVLALILMSVFLPLCAIAFGVFDAKIHELEDVSRLGLPVLGHVHSFTGDRRGSLRDRADKGKSRLARFAGRVRRRKIRSRA